jgi:hypothetical protein
MRVKEMANEEESTTKTKETNLLGNQNGPER